MRLATSFFGHAVGSAPDHEILIVIFPVLVGLLCAVIVAVTVLSTRGVIRPLHDTVHFDAFFGWLVAALSVGAGVIHQAVVEDHIRQYWLFGLLFAGAAVVQIGWAIAYLVRPIRALAAFGLVVNAGIVIVWAWSRSVGLPIGPNAGRPDAIGFVDAVATLFEVAIVLLLAARLLPRTAEIIEHRRVSFGDASIGSVFSVLVIALVSSIAITGFASSPL
jgi:hypothetical protein